MSAASQRKRTSIAATVGGFFHSLAHGAGSVSDGKATAVVFLRQLFRAGPVVSLPEPTLSD